LSKKELTDPTTKYEEARAYWGTDPDSAESMDVEEAWHDAFATQCTIDVALHRDIVGWNVD